MRKYFLPIVLLVLLLMPAVLAAGNVKIKDFSANVTSGKIPLYTRFTGDVTGNVTTWRWIFENIGTGATTYSGSKITTHHNFKKPGIYDVTLKVQGPDGRNELTKPAYITANGVSPNAIYNAKMNGSKAKASLSKHKHKHHFKHYKVKKLSIVG
jgi:PKD repeat protein